MLQRLWRSYHCTSKSIDVTFANVLFYFHLRLMLLRAGQKKKKQKTSTQAQSFKFENLLCNLISEIVEGKKQPGDEPGWCVQGHQQRHLESHGHPMNSMGKKLFIPWRLGFSVSWGLEVFFPPLLKWITAYLIPLNKGGMRGCVRGRLVRACKGRWCRV